MKLDVFAGQEKNELSMIEVARAILEERGRDHEMFFSDLVNAIQTYLEKSDAEIRQALPYFYADLNTDGSFIPLGENKWGLRSWYAIDEIDEEIITLEENDDDEETPKRKKKKVNAFIGEDEDGIDYNDDDPEDEDYHNDEPELEYGNDNDDDEKSEVDSYDSELNEIDIDADLNDEDSVELGEDDDEEDYSEDADV